MSNQPDDFLPEEFEQAKKIIHDIVRRAIQPCYDEGKRKAGYNYSLQACPFANSEIVAIKAWAARNPIG